VSWGNTSNIKPQAPVAAALPRFGAPREKHQVSNTNSRPERALKIGAWISSGVWCLVFGVSALLLTSCSPDTRKSPLTNLTCYPSEIHLNSVKAQQAIVLQAIYADGVTRDVTGRAKLSLLDTKIARITQGILTPLADGKTELRMMFGGRSVSVPIFVTNATLVQAVSFRQDVMPIFTKAGCNAGS